MFCSLWVTTLKLDAAEVPVPTMLWVSSVLASSGVSLIVAQRTVMNIITNGIFQPRQGQMTTWGSVCDNESCM